MAKVIRSSTCFNGDRESEEDAAVEGECRTVHTKVLALISPLHSCCFQSAQQGR